MALAILGRALSLRRANHRAKARRQSGGESFPEFGRETSPEHSAIHSSRVSQSIDALYVLSCLRDGLSLADAFASDEDSGSHALVSCRPSDVEKLTLSSQSLSEHARPSDAWDLFSSSLSSSESESIQSSSKFAVRSCIDYAGSGIEKRGDLCLVFNTGQLISSPSPPSAVVSNCCGFLMGRKSNHTEEDLRGVAGHIKAERETAAEFMVRRDRLMQSIGCGEDGSRSMYLQEGGKREREEDKNELKKGANVALLTGPNGAEGEEEIGSAQRWLGREGGVEVATKQSGNPYLDFRESMLQMMTAFSAWPDGRQLKVEAGAAVEDQGRYMEDLLYCYLCLNSGDLHDLITQAFSDTYSLFFAIQSRFSSI